MISTEPTRGRRFLAYLGLGPEAWPYRRGWMARSSNPDWATSRWDRWIGVLIFAWLTFISVLTAVTHHSWFWRAMGLAAALIGLSGLVRVLRAILSRRPLASSPQPPHHSC